MDQDWNFCQLQPNPTQVSKKKDPTKPFNPQKNKPGVGLDQVHQIARFNECTHQRRTNKRTIKLTETIENN